MVLGVALRINEFIITPQTYASDLPSDRATPVDNVHDTEHEDCMLCQGLECNCENETCQVCRDHNNGLHMPESKLECLCDLADNILEDRYSDILNNYHEISSSKDAYFLKFKTKYKLNFKPGDLVYVKKQRRPGDKDIKSMFDKYVLPKMKRGATVVAQGPEYYHFRPTQGSKLFKAVKDFAGSNTGQTGLSVLGSILGVPGLGHVAKMAYNTYKSVKDA